MSAGDRDRVRYTATIGRSSTRLGTDRCSSRPEGSRTLGIDLYEHLGDRAGAHTEQGAARLASSADAPTLEPVIRSPARDEFVSIRGVVRKGSSIGWCRGFVPTSKSWRMQQIADPIEGWPRHSQTIRSRDAHRRAHASQHGCLHPLRAPPVHVIISITGPQAGRTGSLFSTHIAAGSPSRDPTDSAHTDHRHSTANGRANGRDPCAPPLHPGYNARSLRTSSDLWSKA